MAPEAFQNESLKEYWWEQRLENVYQTIFGIVRWLDQNQGYRQHANIRAMRLYGNLNVLGVSSYNYSQSTALNSSSTDRLSLNIVKSMCDTVTQKIAKNKPKPMFLTSEGDRTLQKKAQNLTKFIQGIFYQTDLTSKGPIIFKDAAVFGTGAVKIFRDGNRICHERTFIDELMVDDREAIYGKPQCLYQRKYFSREVACRIWPKYKAQIMSVKQAETSGLNHASLSTMIMVVEAWHLASTPESNDGRHVICLENVTLEDEKWKYTNFPFAFIRWNTALLGFFGQGLAEELTGLQIEINKILRTVQLAFHLCVPKMMVQNGNKVALNHLNNEIGGILKYDTEKPEWFQGQPVNPQLLEHLERLYAKAYEIAGVSQLAANAQKPAGLDSGKALRIYNDIESERFILVGQAWEQFHLECSKQSILLAKEIYEEDPDYSVTVKGRKFIEKIKWKDVDLEDDEYLMQCFPTSSLSQTPSGRLSDIQDLIQAGFIDKPNALRLLDFPDLDAYMSLANAAIEDIDNLIENITEKGQYEPPQPFQNLQYGIQAMQSAYLRAKNDQVPEDRLELMRRWMEEAQRMLTPSAPAAGPIPAGMPAGQPTGVPSTPPVSQLIPNAPQGATGAA